MRIEEPWKVLSLQLSGKAVKVPLWKSGQGRPLLLLHGWGLDHTSLDWLRDQISADYCCITLDFPGFGCCDLPISTSSSEAENGAAPPQGSPGWGVADFVDLIVQILEALALPTVSLLGHSFGGRVGLRLAALQPERVEALFLIAAAGLRRPQSLRRRLQVSLLRRLGRCASWLLPCSLAIPLRERLIRKIASKDYLEAGPLRTTLVKVVNEDAAPYVARIQAPTLILWGQEDQETPLWMAQELHRLIAHSRLHVLPGFDHHSILCQGHYQIAYLMRTFQSKVFLSSSHPQPSLGPCADTSHPSATVLP